MLFDLYITSVKQDIQHFSRDALTHKLTLDAQRTNGTIRARHANYRDSKKSRCRKKIQILKFKKAFNSCVYIFYLHFYTIYFQPGAQIFPTGSSGEIDNYVIILTYNIQTTDVICTCLYS